MNRLPLEIVRDIYHQADDCCIETFEMEFRSDDDLEIANHHSIILRRNFVTDPIDYIQVQIYNTTHVFLNMDMLSHFMTMELETIINENTFDIIHYGYYQGRKPNRLHNTIVKDNYFINDVHDILKYIQTFGTSMMKHTTNYHPHKQIVVANSIESFEMKFIPTDNINHPIQYLRIWRDFIKDSIGYIRLDLFGNHFVFRSYDLLIDVLKIEIETIVYNNNYDKIYYGYYQGNRPTAFRHCLIKYDFMYDWQDIFEYIDMMAKTMWNHGK